MSIRFAYRHQLVLPDGTLFDLEREPGAGVGELLGSVETGISYEPTGKFVITFIEDVPNDDGPIDRRYHLEKF